MAETKTPETQVPNTEQEKISEASPEKEQNPLDASQERLQKELQVLDNELQDLKGSIDLLLGDNGMEAASAHSPLVERTKTNMTARMGELKSQIDALLPQYNTISEQIERAKLGNVEPTIAEGASLEDGVEKPVAEQQEATVENIEGSEINTKQEMVKNVLKILDENVDSLKLGENSKSSSKELLKKGSDLFILREMLPKLRMSLENNGDEASADLLKEIDSKIKELNIEQVSKDIFEKNIADLSNFSNVIGNPDKEWREDEAEELLNSVDDDTILYTIKNSGVIGILKNNFAKTQAYKNRFEKISLETINDLKDLEKHHGQTRDFIDNKFNNVTQIVLVKELAANKMEDTEDAKEFLEKGQQHLQDLAKLASFTNRLAILSGGRMNNNEQLNKLTIADELVVSKSAQTDIVNFGATELTNLYNDNANAINIIRFNLKKANDLPLPPEQPAPEQPAPEQPAPEQPAPEQPAPEQPAETQEAKRQVAQRTLGRKGNNIERPRWKTTVSESATETPTIETKKPLPEVVEEPSLTEDFSDEIKEGWTGEVNLEDVKSFVEESEKVKVENASEPSVSSEAEPSVVLEDLFAAEIPKNTSPDVVRQDPEANKETLKNLEAINRDNQDKNKKTPAKNVASRPVYSGSSGRSGYSGGGSSSAKAEKGKPEEGFFKKGFKKVKDFFKGLFGIK